MPRITRKQQKIFAENATNNGVFGSLQGNDPTISSDPDAIQGRSAYSSGWNDATYSAELLPPLEEFQALQYLFSRQLAYLMQEGVSEWDANTTYYKGSFVKKIQSDGSFILYVSLIDNNTGNIVTDTTKWQITNTSTNFHQGIPNWRADVIYSQGDWVKAYNSSTGWTIYESTTNNNLNNPVTDPDNWEIRPFVATQPLLTCFWSDHILNDVSYLRADTFSWQSGAVYEAVYNHLVDDIDGKTAITEVVGSNTISYYLADDGHKITTDESTVASIYAETGVAWYFVLDTTNERFKLPRTKYGFTGLRDTVGKYVPESLPNITGEFGGQGLSGGYATGAVNVTITSSTGWGANSGNNKVNYTLDASRSSSTYQDNAPVQERATQMYLYFYVGRYAKTAVEQTAGLNTELFNDKLDLDLGNITNVSKETIVGWGMPDYSAGIGIPQNELYTLPKDGLVLMEAFNSTVGADTRVVLTVYNSGGSEIFTVGNRWQANQGTINHSSVIIPLSKGMKVNGTGFNIITFAFYPMKGA